MTKILLLPMMAAAVCAQAQQRVIVPVGQNYTIGNAASAVGDNVTYQWFINGAVANVTSESWTVNIATAGELRFQRAAYNADCLGGVALSNEVIVYFCALIVNGVCWAKANTNDIGFCDNPWDWGFFYQWNRASKFYSPGTPAAGVAVVWGIKRIVLLYHLSKIFFKPTAVKVVSNFCRFPI